MHTMMITINPVVIPAVAGLRLDNTLHSCPVQPAGHTHVKLVGNGLDIHVAPSKHGLSRSQ